MAKQKLISREERLNQFYIAESEGRIMLPDGGRISIGVATPGQVTWHEMEKEFLTDLTMLTKMKIEVPQKSTVEIDNEKTAEAMRRARGGAR